MADWITDREPEEGVAVLALLDDELFFAMIECRQWYSVCDCIGRWNGHGWEYYHDSALPIDVDTWAWQPLPEPPTPPRSNAEETDKW